MNANRQGAYELPGFVAAPEPLQRERTVSLAGWQPRSGNAPAGTQLLLVDYINAAMAKAGSEILPDDGPYYGHVPGFKGVWADAHPLERRREEQQSVLEDWILPGIRPGDRVPQAGGARIRLPGDLHKLAD